MNSTAVIAVMAVVAVAGVGGGVFFFMNNGGNEATTYSITYDLDGGSGNAPVQKAMKEGETFTVASCEASKTGNTFAGWSDGEKSYAAGSTYTVGTSNIILKAIWNIASYSIVAPKSTAGYAVTAENATVEYNQSYTFTVNVADKYNGDVTVIADGTHGNITTSKTGNTTTVTIPEIASDISNITLGGLTELGIGTHFDYVLSGTWSYNELNGTIEGTHNFEYVAQNSEDFVFINTTVLRLMSGETVISENDTSDNPDFYLGNLAYANYCLDVTKETPAGSAVIFTIDGQKTVDRYSVVNGTMTYTYFVDPSTNILYKMSAEGTTNAVAMNIYYDLEEYEILSESPYEPSEKLTQYAVMGVTGTHSGRALSGTMTIDYWAESPTQYINKTINDIKYTDNSSAFLVSDKYELNDDDEDDSSLPPTGAIRGEDVVMMTVDGEKTLQVWSYTENSNNYTLYIGMNGEEKVPYRVILENPTLDIQVTFNLTEYLSLE